jgi:hypothetical protein
MSDPCTERSIFLAHSSKAPLSPAAIGVSEALSMMFIRWHGSEKKDSEN